MYSSMQIFRLFVNLHCMVVSQTSKFTVQYLSIEGDGCCGLIIIIIIILKEMKKGQNLFALNFVPGVSNTPDKILQRYFLSERRCQFMDKNDDVSPVASDLFPFLFYESTSCSIFIV